jgi:hypothetical protein
VSCGFGWFLGGLVLSGRMEVRVRYDVTVEWAGAPVRVGLDVATWGHPGRFDPYDGGDPPEGPEAEMVEADGVDLAGLTDADHEALLDAALDAAQAQRDAGDPE